MKKFLIWASASLILMLGGPFLSLQFSGINGMTICILLFFAVDPVFSALCGWAAGARIRSLWPLPLITAVSFLAGTWLFLDMGELDFLFYAGIYLLIGTAAMGIRSCFRKLKKRG